jgi:hypothetical protein
MKVMESERVGQQSRREALNEEVRRVESGIAELEAQAHSKVKPQKKATNEDVPAPMARWNFDNDARDQVGQLHGKLHGGAVIENGKLIVGRKNGYFTSAPLDRDFGEKSLQVLVQLDNIEQQGGGALGIQTLDGNVFDSIVFAESEPGQWLPGSERHLRTQDPGGPRETDADKRPLWLTMTYAKDGTIQVYRNGARYGRPYKKAGLKNFQKGKAQAIIGVRHGAPSGGRLLAGKIDEARLFDRALSEKEVNLTLGMEMPPSREEILNRLTAAQRTSLKGLEIRLTVLRDQESEMKSGSRPSNPLADLAHALFNSKEFIYVR